MNENIETAPIHQNPKPAMKKKRKWVLPFIIISVLLLCCVLTLLTFYGVALLDSEGLDAGFDGYNYVTTYGESSSDNKILTIAIKGPILNDGVNQGASFFSSGVYVYGYEIKRQLISAAADSSIKAVMLEIDSPGGTITGSKAISDGVEYYKSNTGNPVYAHIMGVGASGGYWSAASADKIYADYGSMVGSIGVIFGPFKYYKDVTGELFGLDAVTTEGGIETYYITSGSYKDFGNSYRQMDEEEMKSLQEDTDRSYEDFVDFVSNSRKLSVNTIKNTIKALPYGEHKALELGLIDEVADEGAAYIDLADVAGISEDYQIIENSVETDFLSMLLMGKFNGNVESKVEIDYCKELCGKMLYLYGDPQLLK